ncbi:hypothetical protein BIW11_03678 [Tropilaelaps mercedesae]|uniref:Uncharacterized protein n=1 Tax=Tropilaelaps mercedesae TaxID=418985 RepID=A0A1V9XHI8_9ACAR|nr:hypothetical protein BIW11_03678 [Tropilaelaps mercedesae]
MSAACCYNCPGLTNRSTSPTKVRDDGSSRCVEAPPFFACMVTPVVASFIGLVIYLRTGQSPSKP